MSPSSRTKHWWIQRDSEMYAPYQSILLFLIQLRIQDFPEGGANSKGAR